MTDKEQKEEQAWLNSVKRKLFKCISSPYWDCIHISDLQLSIIMQINNTTDVKKLSPAINERIVDILLEDIKTKLTNAKKNDRQK